MSQFSGLGRGSAGPRVAALHQALARLGLPVSAEERDRQTYSDSTWDAVHELQHREGIPTTGMVDEATAIGIQDLVAQLDRDLSRRQAGRAEAAPAQEAEGPSERRSAAPVSAVDWSVENGSATPSSTSATTGRQVVRFSGNRGARFVQRLVPSTDQVLITVEARVEQGRLLLGPVVDDAPPVIRVDAGQAWRQISVNVSGTVDRVVAMADLDDTVAEVSVVSAEPATAGADLPVVATRTVHGVVRDHGSAEALPVTVLVSQELLRGEQPVALTWPDTRSQYTASWVDPTRASALPVVIRAYDRHGETVAQARLMLTSVEARADLGDEEPESQFVTRSSQLRPVLGNLDLSDVREDDEHHDVTLLAAQTGLDTNAVMLLVLAERIGERFGIDPGVTYAFLAQGEPPSLPPDLLASTFGWTTIEQLVYRIGSELLTIPHEHQQQILAAATRSALAPGRVAADEALATLAVAARQVVLDRPHGPGKTSLRELLTCAGIPAEHWDAAVDELRSKDAVREGLSADEPNAVAALPPGERQSLERSLEIGACILNHPPLLRHLLNRGDDPRFRTPHDLAWLSEQDWRGMCEEACGDRAEVAPPHFDTLAREDRAEAFAGQIYERLGKAFPTVRVVTEALKLDAVPSQLAPQLQQMVQTHPDLDLWSTNIDAWVLGDAGAPAAPGRGSSQGEPDGVLSQVKRLARVSRIAPDAPTAARLAQAGIDSATEVTRIGRDQLARRLAMIGVDTDTAVAVHAEATRRYGQAVALWRQHDTAFDRALPAAIPSPMLNGDGRAQVATHPTLQLLFGSQDYCRVEPSTSYTSPPAYLLDLLSWLDAVSSTDPNYPTALQVLLARRPDIALVDFTAANTTTRIPYIDVVCEVLEQALVGGSPSPCNTTLAAAEIRAQPQHVNKQAYVPLATASYPITMPYHKWLDEIDAWLATRQLSWWQLLAAFGMPAGAAYFRFCPQEERFLTREGAHPEMWNPTWSADQAVTELRRVDEFLRRSRLDYGQVPDLLSARYVRGEDRPLAIGNVTDSCDTTTQSIDVLDIARLERAQRFLRKWRRTTAVTQWQMHELDALLVCPSIRADTPDEFADLMVAHRLQQRLGLSAAEIAAFYTPLGSGYVPDRVVTVAGAGALVSAGDSGPATMAQLRRPWSVAVDPSGAVYMADIDDHRVRRIDPETAVISTVAGTGAPGYSGDGASAAQARLYRPAGIAIRPQGELYIADSANNRVRRISLATGVISTVAGTGVAGSAGDGGPSTIAQLNAPLGVAVTADGQLFIADSGNHRIRRVDTQTGVITTVAGTGVSGFGGDGGPATSAQLADPTAVIVNAAGRVLISDRGNRRIRYVEPVTGRIYTLAGNGTAGFGGDGGAAVSAALDSPTALALDPEGNVYVADQGTHRVRRIESASGLIDTVAGNGRDAFTGDHHSARSTGMSPTGVALDQAGNLFVADQARVRKISATGRSGRIMPVAGIGVPSADYLNQALGVAVDLAGNVYIGDTYNNRILRMSATSGMICTVAGTGAAGSGGDGGPARQANLWQPRSVTLDRAGNLYIADSANHRIRRVDRGTGTITTVAGTGVKGFAGDGGSAAAAHLANPDGVAVDRTGNIFVADRMNHRIRRVDVKTGVITTVAGTGVAGYAGDAGPGPGAQLRDPTFVAVSEAGDVYIADWNNHCVRRLSLSTNRITTVAGTGTAGFSGDGAAATTAQLHSPGGVAVDPDGNLWISDGANHRIRYVDAATNHITTVAGTGSAGFSGNGGPATLARLRWPGALARDALGNLYIAEWGNSLVRKILAADTPPAGPQGLFDTLFGNPAVPLPDAFDIETVTRQPAPIAAHVPALAAALQVSSRDLDAALALPLGGQQQPMSLENLSELYRSFTLAQSLGTTVPQLGAFAHLFLGSGSGGGCMTDLFASPAATWAAVQVWDDLVRLGLDLDTVDSLLAAEPAPDSSNSEIAAALADVRRTLESVRGGSNQSGLAAIERQAVAASLARGLALAADPDLAQNVIGGDDVLDVFRGPDLFSKTSAGTYAKELTDADLPVLFAAARGIAKRSAYVALLRASVDDYTFLDSAPTGCGPTPFLAPRHLPVAYVVAGGTKGSPCVLTVPGHPFRPGDTLNVKNVAGLPSSTGRWVIGSVTGSRITLTGCDTTRDPGFAGPLVGRARVVLPTVASAPVMLLRTAQLVAFTRALPVGHIDDFYHLLVAAAAGGSAGSFVDRFSAVMGWAVGDAKTLLTALGLTDIVAAKVFFDVDTLRRLVRCHDLTVNALHVDPARAAAWVTAGDPSPDETGVDVAHVAEEIRDAIKAQHTLTQWLPTAAAVQDTLRGRRRDALVDYLLAWPPATLPAAPVSEPWQDANDLYAYYLIDTQLAASVETSRVVQAYSACQLLVQRALLGLEPALVPAGDIWSQWEYRCRYPLWAAARKVFLHPENLLTESLRRDKSEPFASLEATLNQQNLSNPPQASTPTGRMLGEDALLGYVDAIGQTVHLELVAATTMPWRLPVLDTPGVTVEHVLARESGSSRYWHRQQQDGRWLPWRKVPFDIAEPTAIIAVLDGRPHLFWTQSAAKSDTKTQAIEEKDHSVDTQRTYLETQLGHSLLDNGAWSPPQFSDGRMIDLSDNASPARLKLSFDSVPHQLILRRWEGGNLQHFASATRAGTRWQDYRNRDDAVPWSKRDANGQPGVSLLKWTEENIPGDVPLSKLEPLEARYAGSWGFNGFPIMKGQLRYSWSSGLTRGLLSTVGNSDTPTLKRVPLPWSVGEVAQDWFRIGGEGNVYQSIDLWNTGDGAWEFYAYATFPDDPNKKVPGPIQLLVPHYYECYPEIREQIRLNGVSGLFDREWQKSVLDRRNTLASYQPGPGLDVRDYRSADGVATASCQAFAKPPLDFSVEGRYSCYNWELFFHAPRRIAQSLISEEDFAGARRWLHRVFDPTGTGSETDARRYWVTKPFALMRDPQSQRIEDILSAAAQDPHSPARSQWGAWLRDPFDPFALASLRPVAFMKATVMQYLDTLIAWADLLFRRGHPEDVSEATLLYVLAAEILGPRPIAVTPPPPEPICWQQLQQRGVLDAVGNAWVGVENLVAAVTPAVPLTPQAGSSSSGAGSTPPTPTALPANLPDPTHTLLFKIPANPKLLDHWSTVEDRLSKLRQGLTITGGISTGLLYDAPLDPGLVVAARAAGASLADVMADLAMPLPAEQFWPTQARAVQFCSSLQSLGAALLAAVEKRDTERLSQLRAGHDSALLRVVKDIRVWARDEASQQCDALEKNREMVQHRKDEYDNREYMNDSEKVALLLNVGAVTGQLIGIVVDLLGAGLTALPEATLGITGWSGTPTVTVSFGGSQLGGAVKSLASVLYQGASLLERGAAMAATQAGYQRRREEWRFQAAQADKELAHITQLQEAATTRMQIAQQELDNHRLQQDHADAVIAFLKDKYTNDQLYDWLASELARLYRESYLMAYDLARRAERCWQYRTGDASRHVIGPAAWEGLRGGLLAGERLAQDLKRLELAYVENERGRLAVCRDVHLDALDPLALRELARTGSCTVELNEELFDLDYPGHYDRRIKSVAVTIPCVVGPHSRVNCTLTLLGSKVRTDPKVDGGYPEVGDNDQRFRYDLVPASTTIVTSTAINDTGAFPPDSRDEQMPPFEGAGVVSTWQIDMPVDTNDFDLSTISDVILHLRYYARDGGQLLRDGARKAVIDKLPRTGLVRVVGLRRDRPDLWSRFNPVSSTVSLDLIADMFPFWARRRELTVTVSQIEVVLVPTPALAAQINAKTVTLNAVTVSRLRSGAATTLPAGGWAAHFGGIAFDATTNPAKESKLLLGDRCAIALSASKTAAAKPDEQVAGYEDIFIAFHYSVERAKTP